ncbi:anaerobic ribonucleoside-triphosphate reductase [Reinekea blandensis]|uniref:Anaerobic ribonucleoside triphosphate reductase n=1 Tax=Reinekea blandensis MED297 TaxID=314283 RepID=A4BF92_9GAMM|nr:anaerobic ribonucleoside-triphosphate reductase [Reinekea blandensis]EAR09205.1 anaerobic ribonucleoside triphosphate reductase [Reinekea sp. MED297] [Reinekea blandensis MED297]
MATLVTKRDGHVVPFYRPRITQAILNAMIAKNQVDAPLADQLSSNVEQFFKDQTRVDIEQVQQQVEAELIQAALVPVARAYIRYRQQRDLARDRRSQLTRNIDELFAQQNTALLHENANKDAKVIPTQRDLLAGLVARHHARHHALPADVVSAHDSGLLHYHDLDYAPLFPMFNCMLVDLDGMLRQGFRMGNADIDTPKSIQTATSVTAQIIAQVASHIYGGTTIDRMDEVLAPYVEASYQKHCQQAELWRIPDGDAYAEQVTRKETYDAFQALEYEVNTLHTANGQTPFVTFGFGLGESWSARLVQQSILQVRLDGLGRSRKTAVFPKLVFALKRGLNLNAEDPNYDIKQQALHCASRRMYPDILNYEQTVAVTGSFKTPMGCRSFLSPYEQDGKIVHAGRNNLGVVSLNLPRLALLADRTIDGFWQQLERALPIARKALMTRVDRLRDVRAKVAPILYTEGACGVRLKPDDRVFQLFENGRASISLGYLGIHETLQALLGNGTDLATNPDAQALAKQIVQRLRDAVDQWYEETGLGFSLYATPSENLCDRFCRLDRSDFGLVPGVTDKGYYTNSFHLDVQRTVSPFEKLALEQAFPAISNGGFICYGEFPNLQNNLTALEAVWDYSYDRVPYYGTNTPIDECHACGFSGEFNCTSQGFCCPSCGNRDEASISVTRRVCGYLGAPNSRPFNQGKQEEVKRRVKHMEPV